MCPDVPEEYIRLMDELNDARLLTIAVERMAHFDPATAIPGEEVYSSRAFSLRRNSNSPR